MNNYTAVIKEPDSFGQGAYFIATSLWLSPVNIGLTGLIFYHSAVVYGLAVFARKGALSRRLGIWLWLLMLSVKHPGVTNYIVPQ